MLELFDDKRFIKECSDSQKLDYILWLGMAGLTQNESEEDLEWFKKRFNLSKEVDEIRSNLCFLLKTFKKMYLQQRNGKKVIKFKKFKELHNPLRHADGTPKDSQRTAQNIIYKIIEEYIKLKGWGEQVKDKEVLSSVIQRHCKPVKQLFLLTNKDLDLTFRALRWTAGMCSHKGLEWTLETVIRWYPEFLKHKRPEPDKTPQAFKDLTKGIGDIK